MVKDAMTERELIHKFKILGKEFGPKGILTLMSAFGIAMGLIFPWIVMPFVKFKSYESYVAFYIMCILAGLLNSFICYRFAIFYASQIIRNTTLLAERKIARSFYVNFDKNSDIDVSASKLAELINYTSGMVERIKKTVIGLKKIIEEIKSIGNVNAAASSQLASSLTEISATMEEIARTSTHIVSSVEVLAINSRKTFEAAQEGRHAVETTAESFVKARKSNELLTSKLSEILDRITSINDVVNFIEEISAKTKILALNASIEATRAGEKGKGFSVVASEIRSLTERIADYTGNIRSATKEIFDFAQDLEFLIEDNKQRFEEVSEKSKITQQKLIIIEAAAKETDISIGTIRNAVEQEQTATKQIASSMKEIQSSAQDLLRITSSIMQIASRLEEESEKLLKSLA